MEKETAETFLRVLEQKKWLIKHGVEEYPRVTLEEVEKSIGYWLALLSQLNKPGIVEDNDNTKPV